MVDPIELSANRFAQSVITNYLSIFLANKTNFLSFIKENIEKEKDRSFIKYYFENSVAQQADNNKFNIPYEMLLEILRETFRCKYKWTRTPFEIKDSLRRNILHYAAMVGDDKTFIEIASILKEVNIFEQTLLMSDGDGNKPLYYAAKNRSLGITKYCIKNFRGNLLWQPIKTNGLTLLECAISEDAVNIIEMFKIAIDQTATEKWNQFLQVNVREKYLLHFAIEKGAMQFLRILAVKGIDWNLINEVNGNSPLHFAVISKKFSIVQFILSQSQNSINLRNKQGCTPINIAVLEIRRTLRLTFENKQQQLNELISIIEYLLSQGATLNFGEKEAMVECLDESGFIEFNENIKNIFRYVRWEGRYRRTAMAALVVFLVLTVVGGIGLVVIPPNPALWAGLIMTGLMASLSGVAVRTRFRHVFPIFEWLRQLLEIITTRFHPDISYSSSSQKQVEQNIGYRTADIEKGLRSESEHKDPEKKVARKAIEFEKFLNAEPEESNKFAKDLHDFILTLSDDLEKIHGAPRLGVDGKLLKELKDGDNSTQVKAKLIELLDKRIKLPIPEKAQELLITRQSELKQIRGPRGFISNQALQDVQADPSSGSDSDLAGDGEVTDDSEVRLFLLS